MRTEVLRIKLYNLKTKQPKFNYTAYINDKVYNDLFNTYQEQTKLFKYKIINEITIKPSNKIKPNEIIIINNKLLKNI
jgi:hypothetical protein